MPMHLLIVDDEPDFELLMRQRLRRRIRAGEVELLFARDGVEALAQLEAHPEIDIVLTDINMPRMDGLTLLDRIREQKRLVKVVIVSAYGDMSNIRTAMNRGAFDFITKPISFEDLDRTLEKTYDELRVLKEAVEAQRQLSGLRRELEIAREIQFSTLPRTFPAFPDRSDFDLYATMRPAQEVGGDFYDFFLIDERHLGLVLGDVSGKGVGAAMFMVMTRTLLRATALRGASPNACLRHVNRILYQESPRQLFVTVFYGVLDTQTGELTYCIAGHDAPFVVRHQGHPKQLARTGGLGLSLVPDFDYRAAGTTLEPGDSLVLFSDGVTEATNGAREFFDVVRLHETLRTLTSTTPQVLTEHVLTAVEAFADGAPPTDDLTLLVVQYQGQAGDDPMSAAVAQASADA